MVRDLPRFLDDGLALHVEGGKGTPFRTGEHRLIDQAVLDRRGDHQHRECRDRHPKRNVERVVDRQAVRARGAALDPAGAETARAAEGKRAHRRCNGKDDGERQEHGHGARRPSYLRVAGSSGFIAAACAVASDASLPPNGTSPRFWSTPPVDHILE